MLQVFCLARFQIKGIILVSKFQSPSKMEGDFEGNQIIYYTPVDQ